MPRAFRLAAATLAALVLAGAAAAQGYRTVSGTVSYLDRMALAPDAVLLVEVVGHDLRLEAEARLPTGGRQVPVPFAIDIPEGAEGTLRAGLATGGTVVWLSAPVALVLGGPDDLGQIMLARHQPMGFVARYRCGDAPVRLGFTVQGQAVMEADGARRLLEPVPAASGARYEAEGDPGTFFWSRGDAALVGLGGVDLPECRLALPLDETPWRAGGNEPFWSVTIAQGAMTLTRPGMDDLALDVQDAVLTEAGDILVTATHPDEGLRAVLRRQPVVCRDSMTGLPHPETVELSFDDQMLEGCGGAPADLLIGRTWVVEDIAGTGLIDGTRVTLGFGTEGRVAGSGGCNRWFAGYELTGEGLSIGPAGATMMACAPALMAQERRFFEALAQVTGFDLDATGALVLLAAEQPSLTLRAATDGSAP